MCQSSDRLPRYDGLRWYVRFFEGTYWGGFVRYSGRAISTLMKVLVLAACASALRQAAAQTIPAHKAAIVLFDGSDLKSFDTFLTSKGLNSDPEQVFQVEHGVIHISGKEMGYIITKKTYQDFYLRAEFKREDGTYVSREGK